MRNLGNMNIPTGLKESLAHCKNEELGSNLSGLSIKDQFAKKDNHLR